MIKINFHKLDKKFPDDRTGFKITARPLLEHARNSQTFAEELTFSGMPIAKLSEFYVISVEGRQTIERVIKIPTGGMPEERENVLVTSIVSNKNSFFQYISYLLGDDILLSSMEINKARNQNENSSAGNAVYMPDLYEKMLKAAATDPQRFKGIEYLLAKISKDGIIPENFKKLHDTFKKVMKK